MARKFIVRGPFDICVTTLKAGRIVQKSDADNFWATKPHSEVADSKGCYVFAMKAAKGSKPVYVGQATKSFRQETFETHKREKLNKALAIKKKGKLVVYFVCLETGPGKTNELAIDRCETFLIQASRIANPKELLNKHKAKVETWSIAGIIRSPKGPPPKSASLLRRCLKLPRSGS
jgi:hypothetical protein